MSRYYCNKMGTEIWKEIEDFDNHEVSNLGNIRNKSNKKILVGAVRRDNYKEVCLSKNNIPRTFRVNILVAKAFIPNPENKPTVNHKDHNRLNNNVENLEWATQKEQNEHKRPIENRSKLHATPVWRVDKDTNEKIERYETIQKATEWLKEQGLITNNKSNVVACTQGRRKLCGGYNWNYCDEENNKYDDELWREITLESIENNRDKYSVSNYGRIKNNRNKIINGYTDEKGYKRCSLGGDGKHYRIHILVAKHFIVNPNNKTLVNHKDGNKENNHVDNLEWATNRENSQHAVDSGLHNRSKPLIQFDINMNKIKEFDSPKQAATKLNICHKKIGKCCRGAQKTVDGFIFKYINKC